jgi:hypothetical protein
MTREFQTDKQNGQKTRKTDTAGGRRGVAGHGVSFVDVCNITPPNAGVKG